MIREFLNDEKNKIPSLAFHSMTKCDNIITIYGGATSKDKISGDIYFLKTTSKNLIKCGYDNNKESKLKLKSKI